MVLIPSLLAAASFLLPSLVSGIPLAEKSEAGGFPLLARQDNETSCEYDSSTAPTCWGDYSLSTNYVDDEVPDTGVTREYWFDLTNTTASPDGVERIILSVNGSMPGPTIIADWGDTVVVHLTNSLENNGTSMHFHGIRQYLTNQHDGVASITQCPLAPADTMTYTWKATQYGSSWYHSHFSLQAYSGFYGGIIINGPHSAPYDVDLGVMTLTDWTHQTADELFDSIATSGPPQMNNGLINGTNMYGDLGTRYETVFEAGLRYRIRLVNGAIDTHYKFLIDNHNLTVISNDFVAINSYETDIISIGIGERYDVIVEANQDTDNYWLRAIPQETCSDNENPDNILGIVRYDSSSTADPTSELIEYEDSCEDEDMDNLIPYLSLDAGEFSYDEAFDAGIVVVDGIIKWALGDTSFVSDWDYPTLEQVIDGNDTYTDEQAVVELPTANQWVYFVVQNTGAGPHPTHLHGHDFWVLAQGEGTYDEDTVELKTVDTPRRDVAMLPGSGYLVLGFYTDNPGVWLMHCHIGWHAAEGFALQLVERIDEIEDITDTDLMSDVCANWDLYSDESGVEQHDAGI